MRDRETATRHRASAIAFAVALLFAPAAHAQQPDDCLDRAITQADINRCAAERVERADAALDSVYHRLLDAVDEPQRDVLAGAQTDWAAYRDAHCAFVASRYAGASMHPNALATCRARLAERRTRELEEALEALEGPGP